MGGIFFCLQALITKQRIKQEGINFIAIDYFGRVMRFDKDQVIRCELIDTKGFKCIVTLLDKNKTNYKVTLKDGRYFYLNGAIPDIEFLIEVLS